MYERLYYGAHALIQITSTLVIAKKLETTDIQVFGLNAHAKVKMHKYVWHLVSILSSRICDLFLVMAA